MLFIEMSRELAHGGGSWSFPNCVWAPSEKRGGGSWPFWSKVESIKRGDQVLHLRGKAPEAYFVGYSTASGPGFETKQHPPEASEWDYAESFYRADLADYTPFHQPISLSAVFSKRRSELESYFLANKARGPAKQNLFYVIQGGKLQCQNGGYLSDADEELLAALFGEVDLAPGEHRITSIETSSQLIIIRSRVGQSKFARAIKELYGNRCCFPGCDISDERFLVGSHIARWSDSARLRGHLGNGLCFCVLHDKAFELGLFTIDEALRVFVNQKQAAEGVQPTVGLLPFHGQPIRKARVAPLEDALLEHWVRVDIDPLQPSAGSLSLPSRASSPVTA